MEDMGRLPFLLVAQKYLYYQIFYTFTVNIDGSFFLANTSVEWSMKSCRLEMCTLLCITFEIPDINVK